MRKLLLIIAVAIFFGGAPVWAGEAGLVGHYAFEEGHGSVVKDLSGKGNDGKVKRISGRDAEGKLIEKIIDSAKWERSPWGMAFKFDGGYFVDCGVRDSLNISSAGTVMVWCKPTKLDGGLVCWSPGPPWSDQRLVLAFYTYRGGETILPIMSDGTSIHGPRTPKGRPRLPLDQWSHLALTFDGKTISFYDDGVLAESLPQTFKPKLEGVPLWLGRSFGLSRFYDRYTGLMDDVRIYNRALSSAEILAYYKQTAPAAGKDVTAFEKLEIEAYVCPFPEKIVVHLDPTAMRPLPQGARLRVILRRQGVTEPEKEIGVSDIPEFGPAEVIFDIANRPPCTYTVSATVLGPDGAAIGKESSTTVEWKGKPDIFKNVKVLNNLCWELLNVSGAARIAESQSFVLPIDRWVFIRTKAEVPAGAEVKVVLDSEGKPAILHTAGGTLEAMRYLKAGQHTLHISRKGNATLAQLTVRAIPALQHAYYGARCDFPQYGPYDWEFLRKHNILSNVNFMISNIDVSPAHIQEWKESGRSWIWHTTVPSVDQTAADAVEKAYRHWSSTPGYQHPLMDGVIPDEFHSDGPIYDIFRQAVEKLNADFKGRIFIPYGGDPVATERTRKFTRAVLDGGGYVASLYGYLIEQPTEEAALKFIRDKLAMPTLQWEKRFPGLTHRSIIVLGYMSQPNENLNVNPLVNFRVFMDMEMRTLATDPAFFGLGGIQWYHAHRSDEENVRWGARLLRHYAIEGNTEPLSKEPYNHPSYIQNPDFADGTNGWTIQSAEPNSIQAREHKNYNRLQGRFGGVIVGDSFLWMKRSQKKPNTFSQEIKNLEPGRLYSMKMITSDYQNLIQEISERKEDAISINLEGAETLTDASKNFQYPFASGYWVSMGKFGAKRRYMMNYHWRVFRAKGTTAKLTVSDWKSDAEPGGPVGQELTFNFIEIQPYMDDEK